MLNDNDVDGILPALLVKQFNCYYSAFNYIYNTICRIKLQTIQINSKSWALILYAINYTIIYHYVIGGQRHSL